MSIDSNDTGDKLGCKIISKYFTSKFAMDESLSDFQEKKVTHTECKKKLVNKKPSKNNSIKKDKKPKGQRDIRTLVKPRQNELISYTKDFDKACKASGLDVGSEELQLAIALSKSLQDFGPQQDEVSSNVTPLTAKERSRKIKSTLQEYGFKVPKTVVQKIRKRVTNKNYKLLNTSESIKKEIISNKYLEILQRNPTSTISDFDKCDYSDNEVYFKTTNIVYSKIRSVDEFYVTDLIEKTTRRTNLLRDWSEIPGRPLSPIVEIKRFKFDEVSFSQEELDCILSHPLQEVQKIIKSKSMKNCQEAPNIEKTHVNNNINSNQEYEINTETCNIKDSKFNEKRTCTAKENRSLSPDLFDEEDYTPPTLQFDNEQTQHSELKCSSSSDKSSFMDLTDCVQMNTKFLAVEGVNVLEDTNIKKTRTSFYTPKDNIFLKEAEGQNKAFEVVSSSGTFREINDFMEVTDCVPSELNDTVSNNFNTKVCSKSIQKDVDKNTLYSEHQIIKVNKNVQSPLELIKENPIDVDTEHIENIDLTQASDNTILCSEVDTNQTKVPISVDLTQSSNSNEDFPEVKLSDSKEESLDATIIVYDNGSSNDDFNKNNYGPESPENSSHKLYDKIRNQCNTIMDTGTTICANITNEECYKLCSDSIIFETRQYIGSPVGNIISDNNKIISILNVDNTINDKDSYNHSQSSGSQCMSDDKIDLTRSPQSPNITHSIESLGKQNNISIDYDELYDNMMTVSPDIQNKEDPILDSSNDSIKFIDHVNDHSVIIRNDKSLNNTVNHHTSSNNIELPQGIQNYESKTDKSELEENMNNCSKNSNITFLPSVKVKQTRKITETVTETNHTELSPIKLSDVTNKSIGTPPNDQYIIKTQDVTPMLDYESLSTPARNKELEKYGIKPFKRKRAIQLLKYIYNETHPVVEDCAIDDMPSTSKKFKLDDREIENISENKNYKSLEETDNIDIDKENNLYMETKVNPDIKKIECCPDDWVFQTREKAKVHSCRVPLHIAFQNYVSCRDLLRTAILRYEPVNIDIIHKDLITSGYRYNPKELLKFLDKKCITVKTTENNARNRKLNKS